MCTFQDRLKTFEKWSSQIRQTPSDLANCGFYYTEDSDKVVCFYCGIGLHRWLPDDNPWIEHALHSNECVYLVLNKGKASLKENVASDRLINLMVKRILLFVSCVKCKMISFLSRLKAAMR
jgi:hypothetical protein